MLKRCEEEDFYQIRMVALDRLSPDAIPVFFWATFIISGIMTAVVNFGSEYSIYINNPIWPSIINIYTVFLIFHFIIALFFSFEKNYYKYQKLQSVLLSIISLKFSFEIYPFYFLICEDKQAPSYLTNTAFILAFGGIAYLVISTIRGIKEVQKGEFRKGGKGLYNFKQSKGYVSLPIIFGTTMIGGAVARGLSDSASTFGIVVGLYFFLFLCIALQYTIAFAWPEFFLLTYCKFRFESFQIPMPKRVPSEKKVAKWTKWKSKQPQQVKRSTKKTKRKKAGGRKR